MARGQARADVAYASAASRCTCCALCVLTWRVCRANCSGLMQPKMGGYAPNAPPMPALVSSQTRTAPEDWDKLPSWA